METPFSEEAHSYILCEARAIKSILEDRGHRKMPPP